MRKKQCLWGGIVIAIVSSMCFSYMNSICIKSKAANNKIFVSATGNNKGDGSSKNPYGSIEYALANIQKYDMSNIEIVLSEGNYYIAKTIDLSFLANTGKKITFTNKNNEDVFISGGKLIKTSECQKNGNIYSVSLEEYDLSETNYLSSPQLYINNKAFKLAQYPNKGYLKCTGVNGKTYTFNDDHLKNIRIDGNARALGYPGIDWSFAELKVAEINGNTVTLQGESHYGFNKSGRLVISNVKSELDVEGEYYIDYGAKKLYFVYNSDISNANIELSQTKNSLFYMKNVNNMTFKNIKFKNCIGSIFDTVGCNNIKWQNCSLSNATNKAIVIRGGNNNLVINSKIYNTGQGGILIDAGDRNTLTESGNKVQKCVIYDFNILQKTYCPAVSANGCGVIVEENKIYNSEHMAIYFNGNKIVVRKNDISKCVSQTSDCGVIYCGRDWAGFGNVIDSNYIHDNNGFDWTWGIYADDQQSGTTITNNFIENGSGGMLIGGGGYNIIKNNIISNMKVNSIVFDERGLTWNQQQMYNNLNKVQYNNNVWKSTYPELAEFLKNSRFPYKSQVIDNKYFQAPDPKIAQSVYKYGTVSNNIKLNSEPVNTIKIDIGEVNSENDTMDQNTVLQDNNLNKSTSEVEDEKKSSTNKDINSNLNKDDKGVLAMNSLDEAPKTDDNDTLNCTVFVLVISALICMGIGLFVKKW